MDDTGDTPPGISDVSIIPRPPSEKVYFNGSQYTSWASAREAYNRLAAQPAKSKTWGHTYSMDGENSSFSLYCASCDHSIQLRNPAKFFKEHKCSGHSGTATGVKHE
jgi:hypothetical protein